LSVQDEIPERFDMQKPALIAIAGGGIFAALLLTAFLMTSSGGAGAAKSQPAFAAGQVAPTSVTSAEANTWAEARAADTASSYNVYLAAFPEGAFADDAHEAIGRVTERAASKPVATTTRIAARNEPSRASIASACRSYVDATLPAPSRLKRTVGGAVGGCAVGVLAGGSDGRNCAVGAVVGGAGGAISAESRERRRLQEVQSCIASGGPPR